MEKKQRFFSLTVGVVVSMAVGAGGMYLANYKKIEFMNRYPVMLEVEDFMLDTLEVEKPSDYSDETVINAYLALYGDKYTKYEAYRDIFSKEFIVEETNASSVALGSGFQINFDKNDNLYISHIEEGQAADEQGLEVGDIIKSIDGNEIVEYKSAKKIRGKHGTTVKLMIERNGENLEINFKRDCDVMKKSGITSQKLNDVLYVKVDSVSIDMYEPFVQAIEQESFDSLILDLRDNGGGLVNIAIKLSDLFIPKAGVASHSVNGDVEIEYTTDDIAFDVPIVVLVNEKTASAAEIITALLKQYGDATIVGARTFGKGIYQNEAMFKNGTLTYTDGYVTVGDWECYHGIGIEPDVEIPMDSALIGTENDIQLEKALELVK